LVIISLKFVKDTRKDRKTLQFLASRCAPNVHKRYLKFCVLKFSQLFSCPEVLHISLSIDVTRTPEVEFLRRSSKTAS